MEEKKPLVWSRFNWVQIEKDGRVEIGPYESYPHHVECPKCGKDVDYQIWKKGGCIYCGCNVSLEEGE